ncbi:hypothetical protein GZH52_01085 [Crenobacter sp. HX-7-9]|uniref:Uncharacterized protein n=1 Tax=Crenobacter caeni TaxID=2705474 RepID=A0A6B2KMP7_9NEIS|nr:hypothetical protein [Crenobacter caeni]
MPAPATAEVVFGRISSFLLSIQYAVFSEAQPAGNRDGAGREAHRLWSPFAAICARSTLENRSRNIINRFFRKYPQWTTRFKA